MAGRRRVRIGSVVFSWKDSVIVTSGPDSSASILELDVASDRRHFAYIYPGPEWEEEGRKAHVADINPNPGWRMILLASIQDLSGRRKAGRRTPEGPRSTRGPAIQCPAVDFFFFYFSDGVSACCGPDSSCVYPGAEWYEEGGKAHVAGPVRALSCAHALLRRAHESGYFILRTDISVSMVNIFWGFIYPGIESILSTRNMAGRRRPGGPRSIRGPAIAGLPHFFFFFSDGVSACCSSTNRVFSRKYSAIVTSGPDSSCIYPGAGWYEEGRKAHGARWVLLDYPLEHQPKGPVRLGVLPFVAGPEWEEEGRKAHGRPDSSCIHPGPEWEEEGRKAHGPRSTWGPAVQALQRLFAVAYPGGRMILPASILELGGRRKAGRHTGRRRGTTKELQRNTSRAGLVIFTLPNRRRHFAYIYPGPEWQEDGRKAHGPEWEEEGRKAHGPEWEEEGRKAFKPLKL
ncbi:hypothetical protein C8J57DRAFT_1228602 [Mycena rebaudengoi]|nr:hypothetical protein C8J57DRAFT_1228602 [Mycena rebaudengoi]